MTTYTDLTEKTADHLLSAAQPIGDLTRRLTVAATDGVGKLPALPPLPRPEGIPTVREVVTAHFSFAQRMLTAQQDFALGLVGTTTAPARAKATSKKS